MIFFCAIGQPRGSLDFSWVLEGLGNKVELVSIVRLEEDWEPDLVSYKIYHTGPDAAVGVIANEGFLYSDSSIDTSGYPIPLPWDSE